MAGMRGGNQRNYSSEDYLHICPPRLHDIERLKNIGIVVCQCCGGVSDTDEIGHQPMFKHYHNTPITELHRVKEIYCSACLEHFNCIACPVIRGVPAYKTIDVDLLARIRAM